MHWSSSEAVDMHSVIVIGTSAGGLDALKRILSGLPANLHAAVFVVMHIGARNSILPQLLNRVCELPVRHALDGEPIRPAEVVIAPPDRHLLLLEGQVALSHGPKENHTRPAIDPLFRTAAAAYGPRVIGVVLTGYLDDGTAGLQAVKACGGTAVVQDPADAFAPDMPASALENVAVDLRLSLNNIAPALVQLVAAGAQRQGEAARPEERAPDWITIENQFSIGRGKMEELQKIASPSTYTCPECHGTLWELDGTVPKRFRCHTGHSFTANALGQLQLDVVEQAMWTAVQALQEREMLSRDLATIAKASGQDAAAQVHDERAAKARSSAEVLQHLLNEPEPEHEHEPGAAPGG